LGKQAKCPIDKKWGKQAKCPIDKKWGKQAKCPIDKKWGKQAKCPMDKNSISTQRCLDQAWTLLLEQQTRRTDRKQNGAFFTPRFIAEALAKRTLEPFLHQARATQQSQILSKLRIIDHAVGSGALLLAALELLAQCRQDILRDTTPLALHRRPFLHQLYGVDLDASSLRTARKALLLACALDDEAEQETELGPKLLCADALLTPQPLEWPQRFDIALGNPPFGSVNRLGRRHPTQQALASNFADIWQDKLDLSAFFLRFAARQSARLGFVLPSAILAADKASRLRTWLRDHCRGHVLDLGDARPFSAQVCTSLVVLNCRSLTPTQLALFEGSEEYQELGETGQAPNRQENARPAVDSETEWTLWRVRSCERNQKENPPKKSEQNALHPRESSSGVVAQEPTNINEALEAFANASSPPPSVSAAPIRSQRWNVISSDEHAIHTQMARHTQPLGERFQLGKGMETGANAAFELREQDHPERFHPFVQRRVLGADIQPFKLAAPSRWLILPQLADHFDALPHALQQQLREFEQKLRKRAAFRRGNCEWWRFSFPLHAERYERAHRVLTPYRSRTHRFAPVAPGEGVGLTDTSVIFTDTADEAWALCALLNSALLARRYRALSKHTGAGVLEFFENQLREIPLPLRWHDYQPALARLARSSAALDTTARQATQAQVEALLHEAYGLSPVPAARG
jgi:hypothetical protein